MSEKQFDCFQLGLAEARSTDAGRADTSRVQRSRSIRRSLVRVCSGTEQAFQHPKSPVRRCEMERRERIMHRYLLPRPGAGVAVEVEEFPSSRDIISNDRVAKVPLPLRGEASAVVAHFIDSAHVQKMRINDSPKRARGGVGKELSAGGRGEGPSKKTGRAPGKNVNEQGRRDKLGFRKS